VRAGFLPRVPRLSGGFGGSDIPGRSLHSEPVRHNVKVFRKRTGLNTAAESRGSATRRIPLRTMSGGVPHDMHADGDLQVPALSAKRSTVPYEDGVDHLATVQREMELFPKPQSGQIHSGSVSAHVEEAMPQRTGPISIILRQSMRIPSGIPANVKENQIAAHRIASRCARALAPAHLPREDNPGGHHVSESNRPRHA